MLRYVSDDIPGITRSARGKGFVYFRRGKTINSKTRERVEKLAIPPAWEQVWICPTPNGHIQATGRDEKGRKQYIYHEEWNKRTQQTKFHKLVFFGEVLPEIRKEIMAGMKERGLTQKKIISTIIWLLSKTYIRVGNEEYAEENQSYGLTTMRMKHVDVDGNIIHFDFKGKSGQLHSVQVTHPRVAKIIKKLEELPGYELFQFVDAEGERHTVGSQDINDFLKRIAGDDVTAKDFRTWGGTVFAAENLFDLGEFEDKKHAKKNINTAVKNVSKHLGNTTTVCRTYYIHPTVIKTYEQKELVPFFKEAKKSFKPGKNLSTSEYSVHKLIKKYSS